MSPLPPGESPWRLSNRADPRLVALADRHYSRQKPGTPQFVPPGRCFCLITADGTAGWVTSWPFAEYVKHEWAGAWTNSFFRREGGAHRASDLIRWAVAHTRSNWPAVPPLGIISMIDAAKTEHKEVPGWCYLRAGWTRAGFTKGGLHVMQQLADQRIGRRSEPMPPLLPVPGSQASLFEVNAS